MNLHPPTREILQHTVAINTGKNIGTALAYPINNFLYLITAAHALQRQENGKVIQMEHQKNEKLYIYAQGAEWKEIDITTFYPQGRTYDSEKDVADMAILKTSIPCNKKDIGVTLISKYRKQNIIFGQDAFIIGFPFFDKPLKYRAQASNANWAIPFIKKACISYEDENAFYLDCDCNEGFSGGPAIYHDYEEGKNIVLGIISSYITQKGKIHGIPIEGSEVFFKENSGVAVAYKAHHIEPMIHNLKQEK